MRKADTQSSRIVPVMGEPAIEPAVIGAIKGIPDEAGRGIAGRAEVLGERGHIAAHRVHPSRAQLMRPQPREHGRVRGERPGCRRTRPIEADTPPGQDLEVRGGRPLVPVDAQMVGPHGVQHDEQDIGRARRRQGTGPFPPSLERIPADQPARLDQDRADQSGRRPAEPSPRSGHGTLQRGADAGRQAHREDQPGPGMNPPTEQRDGRQEGPDQDQPQAEPSRPPGPSPGHQGATAPKNANKSVLMTGTSQTKWRVNS